MTVIFKEGYNGQPLRIKVNSREADRNFEIWITQDGLPENQKDQTLTYATIAELIDLKDEIDEALKEALNL